MRSTSRPRRSQSRASMSASTGLSGASERLQSDHFAALKGASYDIIVSNPPYVGRRELRALPAEYRHEPQLALAAGRDGLDSVRVILRRGRAHLRPGGILVVEVGNTEWALRRAFPRLPFVWLSFERGGGGSVRARAPAAAAGRDRLLEAGLETSDRCRATRSARLFAVTTFGESHGAGARLHRRWLSRRAWR